MPLGEVTDAMQIFLGSPYVNDFDFNNRAYRVYVQADQQFRANPQRHSSSSTCGRGTGEMMPLEQRRARCSETTAPQVISHFNLFRSAEINGSAAPGVSSGQALQAMEQLADRDAAAGHVATRGRACRSRRSRPGSQSVVHLRPRRCCSST